MACKYEGTGIWAGRCIGTKEVDPCPGYDKCKRYKPNYTTNADRIRAMSDEELAEWVTCPQYYGNKMVCDTSCVACCLEWLKQPAKEDAE
jgi:hypothetical protein